MSGTIPYIGSRISLISKADNRYEGTLYTIDTKESTVSLQNVRSFGSEGRKTDGPQVPPSDVLYDYIIFKGTDIKDLHVVETTTPAPKLEPVSDPAILAAQKSSKPPPKAAAAPAPLRPPGFSHEPKGPPPGIPSPPHTADEAASKERPERPRAPRGPDGENADELTYRSLPGQPAPQPAKFNEEYDFEEFNKQFDKSTVLQQVSTEKEEKVDVEAEDEERLKAKLEGDDDASALGSEGKAYDKGLSFFDTLSAGQSMKQGRLNQQEREKLRETDLETFGAAGIHHYGRGRGYRGRGRGGYRGGYNRGYGAGYSRGGQGQRQWRGRGGHSDDSSWR